MQKLPIGEQFFDRLREKNLLYVDKTRQIYDLMQVAPFVFLSRPRRFGKSLLTTTLREIYRGNRDLFRGLWIEDKLEWQPSPVILINFNDVSYRTQSLAQGLMDYLDELAHELGFTLSAGDPKKKFRELIAQLSTQGKITLLIDEYDKPITDLLENAEKVQENVNTLKDFYSVLKSSEAQHLQFTFITGVSKYGKLSIFSDLNNLIDITVDSRFATLLGYTQQELEHYFADYLDRLAQTFQLPRSEILRQAAFWYNGYSWDGVNRVYVPFSTLLFLELQTFENHWFATGTPTFLIKLLRQKQVPAYSLESITADTKLLNSADVNQISVVSLLFQTGYLTIKRVQRTLQGQVYELGYPNYEVAHAFQQHLLVDYLDTNPDQVNAFLLVQLQQALQATDIDAFITTLQAVFADIPSRLFLPQEAYYHSVVYLVLRLLGFTIHAERMTNIGRIDAVLVLPDKVYILEFKMTTGQIALDQIRDKKYAQPFLGGDKTVILLGIAFDKSAHNITDWEHEVTS
ncbi:MAG: AAA family ATPase [Caldilinea sp. CFX5]|nr:AAA family ATPase [Caldilinea sp. CFX5]